MPDDQRKSRPYERLNQEQLRKAEATATRFLEENSTQIAETMRAKVKFLETLMQRLALKKTGFQDRLDYLARISEIAGLIQEDADGFFELAAEPVVARVLSTVPKSR
jgi:ppGpp synthetase/RelA/SpoT-type nucleotidyltranferase